MVARIIGNPLGAHCGTPLRRSGSCARRRTDQGPRDGPGSRTGTRVASAATWRQHFRRALARTPSWRPGIPQSAALPGAVDGFVNESPQSVATSVGRYPADSSNARLDSPGEPSVGSCSVVRSVFNRYPSSPRSVAASTSVTSAPGALLSTRSMSASTSSLVASPSLLVATISPSPSRSRHRWSPP